MNQQPTAAAIIVAAGAGTRMAGIDKVLSPIAGIPVLLRSTRPFQDCPAISRIIIVVSGEKEPMCRRLIQQKEEWSKVADICLGGARRQDSVAEGLKHVEDAEGVVIHDGARPLVTVDLIERGLEAAQETGAAVAAMPVKDTIKVVNDHNIVIDTPSRISLQAVQTPQVFRYEIIAGAYRQLQDDVTDDASLVERAGYRVKLYEGSYDNIKITSPGDLAVAEALLKKYE